MKEVKASDLKEDQEILNIGVVSYATEYSNCVYVELKQSYLNNISALTFPKFSLVTIKSSEDFVKARRTKNGKK